MKVILPASFCLQTIQPLSLHAPAARCIPRAVDAAALTPEQRARLWRALSPRWDYLAKLVARMEALGWSAACPMYLAAVKARDSVGAMLTALDDAEPPAPFLAHYRPGESVDRDAPRPLADWKWVGKRRARRRRR